VSTLSSSTCKKGVGPNRRETGSIRKERSLGHAARNTDRKAGKKRGSGKRRQDHNIGRGEGGKNKGEQAEYRKTILGTFKPLGNRFGKRLQGKKKWPSSSTRNKGGREHWKYVTRVRNTPNPGTPGDPNIARRTTGEKGGKPCLLQNFSKHQGKEGSARVQGRGPGRGNRELESRESSGSPPGPSAGRGPPFRVRNK